MGLVMLTVDVCNPARPNGARLIELFVDTGVVYSVMPTLILKQLGITAFATERFHLPNDKMVVRRVGAGLFRYSRRVGYSNVIFGMDGDCALLGQLTLTSLGLFLDPLRRELRPLPMVL